MVIEIPKRRGPRGSEEQHYGRVQYFMRNERKLVYDPLPAEVKLAHLQIHSTSQPLAVSFDVSVQFLSAVFVGKLAAPARQRPGQMQSAYR